MPILHVICGPAGVGKSTYGRRLAAQKKACFLDSDTVTEPAVRAGMAFGGGDPDDRDSETYRKVFRDPVYHCLFAAAAENLPHVDVVIVGPFTTEIRDPKWADELARKFEVEIKVTFLICDEDERKRRIENRGNPRDALKLRDWAGYLANTDLRLPACGHEVVKT